MCTYFVAYRKLVFIDFFHSFFGRFLNDCKIFSKLLYIEDNFQKFLQIKSGWVVPILKDFNLQKDSFRVMHFYKTLHTVSEHQKNYFATVRTIPYNFESLGNELLLRITRGNLSTWSWIKSAYFIYKTFFFLMII